MRQALEVRRVSATDARTTVRDSEPLSMLIDTTTCIGCKACEVACVEWNDLKVEPEYGQRVLNSFQTMPDMTPAFWNLIKFNELPVDAERRPVESIAAGPNFMAPAFAAGESASDGGLMLLMRKDM